MTGLDLKAIFKFSKDWSQQSVFVCLCHAVSDLEVRRVIEEGARCVGEVTEACGAGGGCGCCHEQIEALIEAADDGGCSGRIDLCARLAGRASMVG